MAYKKCIICGEPITDEQGVPYKGRYAHSKCFNIAIKALQKDKTDKIKESTQKKKTGRKARPKAELKEAMSEEEYEKKQNYYKYLRSIVEENELSVKTYALTEDYIKRYSFTYDSILQTLIYLHEIKEKDLTGNIVGLIPYYHTEAQRYYDSINKVAELNKDKNISDMYHEKTIIIQPKKRKIKQIDIKSIGKGVD